MADVLAYTQRTRKQIRLAVGRITGLMPLQGTGTATGTTTTITLAEAKRFPDDRLIGKSFYINAGTASGHEAVVSDNVQSTGVVTFSPAASVAPDTTSQVEIWDEDITPAMVNDLIDMAILEAQDEILYPLRANPLVIETEQKALQLPITKPFVAIHTVQYEDDEGELYRYRLVMSEEQMRVEPDYTAVISGKDARGHVHIRPTIPTSISPAQVWLSGYRKAVLPSADTDSVEMPADYVTMSAAHMLAVSRARSDRPELSAQADLWFRRSRFLKRQWSTRYIPGSLPLATYTVAIPDYSSVLEALAPKLWYPLEESSGTILVDRGSLRLNATFNGTISQQSGPGSATPKAIPYAIAFDAANTNYAVTAHDGDLDGLSKATLLVWAKLTTASDTQIIVSLPYTTTHTAPYYALAIGTQGTRWHMYAGVEDSDGTNWEIDRLGGVPDTNWHLLAITWDGTWLRFYVDGVEQTNYRIPGTLAYTGSPRFTLGARNADALGSYFTGDMAPPVLLDITLGESQLLDLYTIGSQ